MLSCPRRARLRLFTPHAHFSPSHTDKEPNTVPPQAGESPTGHSPPEPCTLLSFCMQPVSPLGLRYLVAILEVSPPAIIHSLIYSAPPWAQVLSPRSRRVSPPAIIHFPIYSAPPWAQVLSPRSRRVSPPAIIHFPIYSVPPWAQVLSPRPRRVSPPAIIHSPIYSANIPEVSFVH